MKQLILSLLLCTLPAAAEPLTPISQLSIELADTQQLPLSDAISLSVETTRPAHAAAGLKQYRGIDVTALDDKSLTVSLRLDAAFTGPVTDRDRRHSFVIDYDEDSVKDVIDGFKSKYKAPRTPSDISTFISAYIENPSSTRGFDIASKVAITRSGDCTEHAVLTTALARALGYPARYMVGTAILEYPKDVVAFGHAWTEVWYENSWQVLDAALLNAGAKRLFYLPTTSLTNEGPGYNMAMVSSIGMLPARITDVRNLKSVAP